jgi:ribosomal protein S18 acetylase RimI-like enzyme
LIVVHPDSQTRGYGAAITRHVEQTLAANDQRLLIVETSGLTSFDNTREFYRKLGCDEEARIRYFYQTGEEKIVFRNAIKSPRGE